MIKRYLGAGVLAPLAGGAAVFLTGFIATVVGDLHSFGEGVRSASGIAFWATIICLVYSLVAGTAAFVYARITHRTPTPAAPPCEPRSSPSPPSPPPPPPPSSTRASPPAPPPLWVAFTVALVTGVI